MVYLHQHYAKNVVDHTIMYVLNVIQVFLTVNAASEKTQYVKNVSIPRNLLGNFQYLVNVEMRCSELYGDIERLAEKISPPTN